MVWQLRLQRKKGPAPLPRQKSASGKTKFELLPAAHGKDDKNPSPAFAQGLGHCAVFLKIVSFTAGYRKQQLTLPLNS
ncbi:MAG: hypothetical protein K2J64_08470 [Desulfovibrio sp.]|nr:hypothetical protein [Desulfovibrio sp.]